ncbi:MAG: M23 family metallopeptidase [Dehalococcoidia bacterium]|nr:M23 family metallopeptidase [Dehalococcoidia bacterium]
MRNDLPGWRDEMLYDEYGRSKSRVSTAKMRGLLVAAVVGIAGIALVGFAIFSGGGGESTPADSSGDGAGTAPDGSSGGPANSGGPVNSSSATGSATSPRTATAVPTTGGDDNPESYEGAVDVPPTGLEYGLDRELFRLPLKEWTALGDRFGARRNGDRVHGGLDFLLTKHRSSDILAACSGTVTGGGHSDQLATFLVVDCGGGWTTVYAFIGDVKVQQRDQVEAGVTVIAKSDPAESPFGEHLHFEIRWRTVPVDPELLLDLTGQLYLPTPTPTPEPSPSPEPSPTPSATPRGGSEVGTDTPGSDEPGTGTPDNPGTPVPTAPPPTPTNPPTATPTPTNTPVPTPTPTRTPKPPTPTPTPRPRL